MIAPVKWINDYVDISDINIKELADKLTMTGSAVEEVIDKGREVQKVVVGRITLIERHPDADKLVVCKIDVGDEDLIQIVTGADNINVGDTVPVALNGSTLPGGITIKKGKLRGIESNGMLCSIEELGLSKEDYPEAPEDGIYIFEEENELGRDVKEIFSLDEISIEFEITNNRPDCFSVLGIAREVAASFNKKFEAPVLKVAESKEVASDYVSVKIKDTEKCSRYSARVIEDIEIKESPEWIKKRLIAAGLRPINNIVDITNFVMLEYGQPLHAFDLDKVDSNEIIVRSAKENETIDTLDGEVRTLTEDILVIADKKKPIAIAGIMGGESTKIDENTKVVLLESANFDGTNIRHSSRKLNLRSDSSGKFEKGLDPNNTILAINRAAELIIKYASGKVAKGIVDEYINERKAVKIVYSVSKINKRLGMEIPEEEMTRIFSLLDFKVDVRDKTLVIPTWRPDIKTQEDLAEEVIRIYGYEKIGETLPDVPGVIGGKNEKQKFEDEIKNFAIADGYSEIKTYSFESPKVFDMLLLDSDDEYRNTVTIKNPLGEDYSIMRTLPYNGMLTSLARNYNKRNENVKLFEILKIYLPKDKLPEEKEILVMGAYGDMDFYKMKGTVSKIMENNNIKYSIEPEINLPYYHPGKTASITVRNQIVGFIGEMHPKVCDNYNIKSKVYICTLDMELLQESSKKNLKYKPLPKYPAVTRDISMLVKKDVLVGEIEKVIRKNNTGIIEGYKLFDVYEGNQIEEGYKSVAYSITFRDYSKTLVDEDVNKVMTKILEELESELEAKLRG